MNVRIIFLSLVFLLYLPSFAVASLIRVPLDYPTLQAAIDHAAETDIIEVEAGGGPYQGFVVDVPNLTFRSVGGRAVIEGRGNGAVVEIRSDHIEFSGFSQMTCLPASSASIAWGWCRNGGVAM